MNKEEKFFHDVEATNFRGEATNFREEANNSSLGSLLARYLTSKVLN